MHKRFFGKPRLVGIKAVLFIVAVKRDESLVIHTVFAALGTRIRSEVKHIPNVRRPKVGAVNDLLNHLLVVICLIFLGVIALFGV